MKIAFVMLNPSVANAHRNDMTVRKCIGFASRWGFGGLLIANLIPIVATDPYSLPPWSGYYHDNETYLKQILGSEAVVVAWGAIPRAVARMTAVYEHVLRFRELAGVKPLYCIDTTRDGSPCHPSRTAYTRAMLPWEG